MTLIHGYCEFGQHLLYVRLVSQERSLRNGDSFVFSIENGEFLSLDLGGSKFRVLKVQVSQEGKQNVQMESQFYPTPNEIIRGNGTEVHTGRRGRPGYRPPGTAP